ncbi:hypothetical protein [Cupriavidus taiwanensis]|uniref:hypothetical protein n=1 Tax=Cupriavidus taiwanensis TaxID=164546 RepID=UPI000E108A04|nr:hypothetical protein [Cupriavidus taiwanensis]SPA55845.1 conserved exported protein of unknown function [Cupriavidus taiwanensis]
MKWILAAIAVLVASQLVSGWWAPLLALAVWAGGVLLIMLAGRLPGDREVHPLAATPGVTGPVPAAPSPLIVAPASSPFPVPASHSFEPAATPNSAQDGNSWCLPLEVIGIFFNERWPRTDICTTREYFLRGGDRMLLRYAPPCATPAGQFWTCDVSGRWRDGSPPRQEVRVSAAGFACIPIPHDGVYEIGVGQGDPTGAEHGEIEVWLESDSPDRLAQSNVPLQQSGVTWRCDAAGQWHVEITYESTALDRAAIPARQQVSVPRSAVVLFDPRQLAWDEAGIGDPTTDWEADRRHLFRYYLQLSRGDVLAIEYAWRHATFGVPMEDSHGISFTHGELELSQFVRSPTLLSVQTSWSETSAETSRVMTVVCPDDGIFQLDLTLYGPAAWRSRPSADFLQLRVLGVFLRRPAQVRDFSLIEGWVEDWYRRTVPVPRAALAQCATDSRMQHLSGAQA